MATKILKCNCTHAWQDNRYGYGRRVHNEGKAVGNMRVFHCVVCNREKTLPTKAK